MAVRARLAWLVMVFGLVGPVLLWAAPRRNVAVDPKVTPYLAGLGPVDRVEVSVLGARVYFDEQKSAPDGGPLPRPFPVLPWNEFAAIRAQRTLTGTPAVELAALWRQQVFGEGYSKDCHKPSYGLRFFFENKVVMETSVSWECRNFYVPHLHEWTWHGLDTSTPQAAQLMDRLMTLFPTPPR